MGTQANIFDVKHFAVHDGPGIRTTVFFKGCSLHCVWCHNPESIGAQKQLGFIASKCTGCGRCAAVCPKGAHTFDPAAGEHRLDRDACRLCGACADACPGKVLTLYGRKTDVPTLLPELLEDREFYRDRGGVTLSGGESLLQADFCRELLAALKAEGIHTAVDTCGFVPREAIEKVLPYTDLFLYDMKAFHEDVHIRCTGQSNQTILENLRFLDRAGAAVEIRIPFVPGYNDGEIGDIGAFLAGLDRPPRVQVLPYHSYAISKYHSLDMPYPLPEAMPADTEIRAAEALLRSFGLENCK